MFHKYLTCYFFCEATLERRLLCQRTERSDTGLGATPNPGLTRSFQLLQLSFEPMQQSMFNVRVPLPERGEVFLMNTLTDAQLIVAEEVAGLLDRLGDDPASLAPSG